MSEKVKVEVDVVSDMDKEAAKMSRQLKAFSAAATKSGKTASAGLDKVSTSAKKATKSFSLMEAAAGLFTVYMGQKAVRAVTGFGKAIVDAGGQMETYITQFTVLLKSADNAAIRMEYLEKFAEITPFKLDEISQASRVLQTLTKGALSTGDGLRLVGDSAAVTGADFANLAMWVGRAYDGLQSNRPVGEAMMRMQELGLVSGAARSEIEALQKAGKGADAWGVMQRELEKTSGGMEALSKTNKGLKSTFDDLVQGSMRKMASGGLLEGMNSGLEDMNEVMRDMISNGTFELVGESVAFVAQSIMGFAKATAKMTGAVLGWMEVEGEYTDYANGARVLADQISSVTAELTSLATTGRTTGDAITFQKNLEELKEYGVELKSTTDFLVGTQSAYGVVQTDNKAWAEANLEILAKEFKSLDDIKKRIGEVAIAKAKARKESEMENAGGATKSGTGDADSSLKLLGAAVEEYKSMMALRKNYNDSLKEAEEYATQISLDLMSTQGNKELELLAISQAAKKDQIDAYHEQGLMDYETHLQAKTALDEIYAVTKEKIDKAAADKAAADIKKQIEADKKLHEAKLESLSTMFTGIESLMTVAGQNNKTFAKIAQGVVLGRAAVNTALSITESAASAPWPYNLPAIAGSAAIGAGEMMAIASQSFATGGIIQGPSTGDQVPINANGGEAVLTVPQQAEFMNVVKGNSKQSSGNTFNVTIGSITSENKDEVLQEFADMQREVAFRGI